MSGAISHAGKPELLAPAGAPEALRAAVNNGADAVYLGLRDLNARRGAANFSLSELSEATRYAHIRAARVYLTANIVVLASEMKRALDTVDSAWAAGVDAVIVQDLGLLSALRESMPHVRVHASTQIGTHNSGGVRALSDLGVSRVTLARELSVDEISVLARASELELESFVHGALCVSYSGQCLMSSMIGGRSANRGLCAQPCRMAYRLLAEDGVAADAPGPYLLSPKDLAAITLLPRLAASGVAALKIEGRMKSPEYVALVVGVYRAALDRAAADPDGFSVTEAELEILEEAFNRGFTEGSLTGKRGSERMSYSRPNNRGMPVGRVLEASASALTVALDRALDSEDTIEVWTGRGRFAQRVGGMTVAGVATRNAPAGVRAELCTERRAAPGDRVFRVANAALLEAARRTFSAEAGRRVSVDVAVEVQVGRPLAVELSARGRTGRAEGQVVETARTKTVSSQEIVEHVGRLGGTPFIADGWSIELDTGAGLGFSDLHAVRREAVLALESELLRPWGSRNASSPVLRQVRGGRPRRRGIRPELVVAVGSREAADAALGSGADRALLTVSGRHRVVPLPSRIEALLPRIAHDPEMDRLLDWVGSGVGVTTGNLGLLAEAARRGAVVSADWGVNVLNPWTAQALADLGARSVWASPELSGRQLADLAGCSPLPVGVVVFGRLELMVMEHCVISASGGCGGRCDMCGRRPEGWRLADAKGYEFPVRTDQQGRTHLYNSRTLDLTRSLVEILDSGVTMLRLDMVIDPAEQVEEAVKHWSTNVEQALAGRLDATDRLADPATTGHFFRGVR